MNQAIRRVAVTIEDAYDSLKNRLIRPFNYDKLMIQPYIGHGTLEQIELRGRVIQDRVRKATDNDTMWKNLLNMYRRFASREVPFAELEATFRDDTIEIVCDEEGFFDALFVLDPPLPRDETFLEVTLRLVTCPNCPDEMPEITATADVIVPALQADFGVISDLDDTVIRTDVANILKMARNTFLANARTRLPFEGVAAFYRALQLGTSSGFNPIFYVSNSPWNLYDLLREFFAIRGIPLGPFFMRDLGLTLNHYLAKAGRKHKLDVIRKILALHPNLPFILIGDSSEHDAEIYAEAVEKYPGRILAIYIRDVTMRGKADAVVLEIVDQITERGVDMLLVPDTVAAAKHAIERGFIDLDTLHQIKAEAEQDQQKGWGLEELLR